MQSLSSGLSKNAEFQSQTTPVPLLQFVPIILIFLIFYFILIRPQKKKQVEHERMISQLKKNDEVITSGGIHGTVVNVKDSTLVLKVDENVKIEFQKSTIAHLKKSRDESNKEKE